MLRKFTALTRFEQTLFGLPFIVIGAILPFFDKNFSLTFEKWQNLGFVFFAFISARVSGMSFNQYLDRHIDKLNPRTKNRPLPTQLVSSRYALGMAFFSLICFLLFSILISPVCFLMSCFSASLLILYSFMKRWHFSCHLILGLIHFMAPLTAFVATNEHFAWPIVFLSLAAFFMNAGNDILYAFQDYEFDCKQRLKSIPVHFGLNQSLKIACLLQILCVLALVSFGIFSRFCFLYYVAPLVAIGAFLNFHKKWRNDSQALFLANVSISMSTLLATLSGCLWRVM